MADSRYEQARAVKKSNRSEANVNIKSSSVKRGYKKIKKSPLLIVIAVFLCLGIVAGFFVSRETCSFYMNDYKVNGVSSVEADYVYVDMTMHKQQLIASLGAESFTMGQVYSTLDLKDGGVTAKFLGMDISDSVTVKYYYREDISHEMVAVSSIDVQTAGVYYIEYTTSHFAYKNVKLIRTIIITEVEVDG